MSQKTVFFDIDGTIMDEFGFIPPSAVEAIHAAQAKGVKCIVNTGRPYTHIEPSIVDIGFDGYICSCGQLLMMDGKCVFRAGVDAEVCGEIVKRAQDCLLDAYYEAEESMRQMLHHEPDKGMRIYLDRMIERGFEVWNDPREPGYCFDKFCIWARHDSLLEPFAEYAEKYYTLINRGGGMFECIHKGYSKATGMERVREMLGAEAEDCYAIGDSGNDLPMLSAVKHSIAMGNAPENVKSQVEFVTSSLHDDGLARAMEHYGLC